MLPKMFWIFLVFLALCNCYQEEKNTLNILSVIVMIIVKAKTHQLKMITIFFVFSYTP